MQVDYSNDFYPKIPFYMTYPMQSMYLTEMEYEKDMERMKQYYPAETKEIMELVEQRLDQLEFTGSCPKCRKRKRTGSKETCRRHHISKWFRLLSPEKL